MGKTILVTGIGGLTPRSITTIIRENHPDYKIIGCDIDKKAMGFFMTMKDGKKLVDEYYVTLQFRRIFPMVRKTCIGKEN